LISTLLDAGTTAAPHEDLLQLQSLLLRGKDVYQPEDLAAKLLASSKDVRPQLSGTG
jgi:hypothetical protein